MTDARFEDGDYAGKPVRVAVETPEDVGIAASLLQDAVAVTGEISWMPNRRRLAILMNRFRWEDRDAAEAEDRAYERVRAALIIDSAEAVRARGIDPKDNDQIISILSMTFEPEESDAEAVRGSVVLTLAGDGEISVAVECLDVRIMDLSQPWKAPSGRAPDHALGPEDS